MQPEASLGTLFTQTLQYLRHHIWEERNWNGWGMSRERVSGNAVQGGCGLLIVCVSPHLVYCLPKTLRRCIREEQVMKWEGAVREDDERDCQGGSSLLAVSPHLGPTTHPLQPSHF